MKIKTKISASSAAIILRFPTLESLFCQLCSQPVLRKIFHLGALAYGCVYVLKQPEMRVADLGNYKFYVNIAEPLGIAAYFLRQTQTIWLTSEIISAGDVCVDAGANMGHYTFLMASKVGATGRVFSFEPQPTYNTMIKESIQINKFDGFVFVDQRALWKQTGNMMSFYLSDNTSNSGTSSLINHGLYLSSNKTIEVHTVTLSDFIKEKDIQKIKLIKIDVERAEYEVLCGMLDILENNSIDYIILEMYSHSPSQLLLEKYNYKCFFIDSMNQKLIDLSKIQKDYFGDYLFISPKCFLPYQKCFGNFF